MAGAWEGLLQGGCWVGSHAFSSSGIPLVGGISQGGCWVGTHIFSSFGISPVAGGVVGGVIAG